MADKRLHLLGLGGRTLLFIGLVVLAVAALYRSGLRADWSHSGRYTLHPALRSLVQGVDQPTRMIGLWQQGLSQGPLKGMVQLLERAAAENTRIDLAFYDPQLDQPLLEPITKVHGDIAAPALLVLRGERLFRIPVTSSTPYTVQRDLGGALIQVSQNSDTPLYLLSGHGELEEQASQAENSAACLRHAARLAGFRVSDFSLQRFSELERLPDDGLLAIFGPTGALGSEQLRALDTYLRDGGRLLVLADDRVPSDLARFLRFRGVLMGPGVPAGLGQDPGLVLADNPPPAAVRLVASASAALLGREQRFDRLLLEDRHRNPLAWMGTTLADGRPVLSPRSIPVLALQQQDWNRRLPGFIQALGERGTPPYRAEELLAITGEEAWLASAEGWQAPAAERNTNARYPLAVALEYQPHSQSLRPDQGARLVVWGSRSAASDSVLAEGTFANEALLVDILSWLADRQPPQGIPPSDYRPIRVEADDQAMWVILALVVVILPCCCLGGAMIAWWERR